MMLRTVPILLSLFCFSIIPETKCIDICGDLCKCDLSIADCTERNISSINETLEIPDYVTSVDLSSNEILSINDLTFSAAPESLEILDLSINSLEELPANCFVLFNATLKTLYLQNNVISTLHNKTFAKLKTLEKLVLSFNKISFLPEHLFDDLISLEFLNLNYNPVQTLSGTTFKNVRSLKKLSLSSLGLTLIHPEVFDWNLTVSHLDLSYNAFTSVPNKALWYLRKTLKNLEISGNQLKTLPSGSFFGLVNLKVLKMERVLTLKKIEAFAFKNLEHLETFQMKYLPKIKTIHPKAFRLEETGNETTVCPIRDFTIEFSTLSSLPQTLLQWDKMRYISLVNNRWLCDSNLRWIISSNVMNLTGDTIYCSAPYNYRGVSVKSMKAEDFSNVYVDVESSRGIVALVMIISLAMVLSFATVLILVYRRNGWIFHPPRLQYDKVDSPLNTITIYDRRSELAARKPGSETRERVYVHTN